MHAARPIPPAPFAKILPAIVAGILAADAIPALSLRTAVVVSLLLLGAMILCRQHDTAATLCTYAALFCVAAAMTCATRPRSNLPRNRELMLTLEVAEAPVSTGRWLRTTARIDAFRPVEGDTVRWQQSGEKVLLRIDTSHTVTAGERLIVTGRASDLGSGAYASYARLMQRRGYVAALWVNARQTVLRLPDHRLTLRARASLLQRTATERLARLHLRPDAFATAAAMTTGDRNAIDASLRDRYGATGTSHLLAVSGLHVGIVALLVNLLLWPLAALRGGHLLRNLLALPAIWGYAALTGLSPSVVRAATMFSGVQLALAASQSRSSLNLLCATASIMLLVWPNYLFDVSFQLSFAAVAGIFLLYRPLYGAVRSRFRAANACWSLFMVGLAATLATLPLVSCHFGRIPLIGLVINPLLILTANVTVLASLVWILTPLPALNGFFSTLIGATAGLQNDLIATAAAQSWASLPLRLSPAEALLAYLLPTLLWLLLRRYRTSRTSAHRTVPPADKIPMP